MVRIEVISDKVSVKSGTARQSGKAYSIREQEAYVFLVDKDGVVPKYPTKIKINIEDGQQPYQPGFYTLSPTSLYVGEFDSLKVGRVSLVKQVTAQKAA
jgi:hypothetical protein